MNSLTSFSLIISYNCIKIISCIETKGLLKETQFEYLLLVN